MLNRGLQSQPWWDLVPSLPWLLAQEGIAWMARARAQAEHRGSVETRLNISAEILLLAERDMPGRPLWHRRSC